MDLTRPAAEVWDVQRRPVDILGKLMYRLDFRLRGWEITVHHKMCRTLEEAERECEALRDDIATMMDGPFRSKYRIAYDLKGGF
ncbi:MAG: hypothetical protein GYA63_04075 [Armatimonadetes bacterium]|nr:hypothetical protein [Armatimonadota bacterium]